MQDGVLQFWFDPALIGRLPVRHHHAHLPAQVLLVEAERLGALAGEIHVSMHFHVLISSHGLEFYYMVEPGGR